MKTEAKVGLFVTLALLMLFLLSTQVNRFSNMGKKGYIIYALLTDASGLEKNAKVKLKGVDIGYVKNLGLDGRKVKATLFIYQGIKIPKDSSVILKQESLLGTKYLSIEPGKSPEFVRPGGILKNQKAFASFEETSTKIARAADEFREFIKELRISIKGASGEDLKKSIENLQELTANLKELIKANSKNITQAIENIKRMGQKLSEAGERFGAMSDKFAYTADSINKDLPKILKRVDELTLYLKNSSKTLDKKLPVVMDKFTSIENDLQDILKKNKEPLTKTIKSAHKFFAKGGESFAKLDKYLSSIGKSKIEVNFDSWYMSDDGYNRSAFGLSYIPTANKYYMLEVISRDNYQKPSGPAKHEKSKYYISAMYAKRYDNLRLRLGVIESTGGIGADYYLFSDQGKVSLDIFDFNAVNDVRGDKAHLTLAYRQRFLKHLDGFIGVDNALNEKARNFFFGLGLHFVDDDMKYLLGTASGAGSYLK